MVLMCEDRVVIVTGAGRGLGRAHALEFARQGARVVVNDLGTATDGSGQSAGPADDVVREIREIGGEAVADYHDVGDWTGAEAIVAEAVETFGRVDVLVNNAGNLRDRTIVNMSADEWDAVIHVHLRGTMAMTRAVARHWRDRSKEGDDVAGRLVNTTSSSGLYANAGQANYAAAKAGIAALTIVASRELARYGVTANAVYPTAVSRLTEGLFRSRGVIADDGVETPEAAALDPSRVSPVVVWLGSTASGEITGRIFGVRGSRVVLAEGWRAGVSEESGAPLRSDTVGETLLRLHRRGAPNAGTDGTVAVQPAAEPT